MCRVCECYRGGIVVIHMTNFTNMVLEEHLGTGLIKAIWKI